MTEIKKTDDEFINISTNNQPNKINSISVLSNTQPEKPKTKRMRKIKPKKRTLKEFKNWLEGLQEFQTEDWVPSKEQWDHIKASIAVIKEPEIIKSTVESVNVPVAPLKQYNEPLESSLDDNSLSPPRAINSHIDMRNPQSVKQDIDTSDGNYTSDFE